MFRFPPVERGPLRPPLKRRYRRHTFAERLAAFLERQRAKQTVRPVRHCDDCGAYRVRANAAGVAICSKCREENRRFGPGRELPARFRAGEFCLKGDFVSDLQIRIRSFLSKWGPPRPDGTRQTMLRRVQYLKELGALLTAYGDAAIAAGQRPTFRFESQRQLVTKN